LREKVDAEGGRMRGRAGLSSSARAAGAPIELTTNHTNGTNAQQARRASRPRPAALAEDGEPIRRQGAFVVFVWFVVESIRRG
jgi:hypothetical protein